jgi:hypothetical protein
MESEPAKRITIDQLAGMMANGFAQMRYQFATLENHLGDLDTRVGRVEDRVRSLMRNLGGSTGISILVATLAQNTPVVHSRLVEGLRPDNPLAQAPYLASPFSLSTPGGMTALNAEVTRQAAMVAYVDDFKLIMLIALASLPLLLLLRGAAPPTDSGRGRLKHRAPAGSARPARRVEVSRSPASPEVRREWRSQVDPTARQRGHVGRQWVDLSRPNVGARAARIGAQTATSFRRQLRRFMPPHTGPSRSGFDRHSWWKSVFRR